jgi:hypothetical protein
VHTRLRQACRVNPAFTLHPAPPAHLVDNSLTFWIWLIVILALAVVGGVVLTLRR